MAGFGPVSRCQRLAVDAAAFGVGVQHGHLVALGHHGVRDGQQIGLVGEPAQYLGQVVVHARADAGAFGEEEVGQVHMAGQRGVGHGPPVLVGKAKRADCVQRIGRSLPGRVPVGPEAGLVVKRQPRNGISSRRHGRYRRGGGFWGLRRIGVAGGQQQGSGQGQQAADSG